MPVISSPTSPNVAAGVPNLTHYYSPNYYNNLLSTLFSSTTPSHSSPVLILCGVAAVGVIIILASSRTTRRATLRRFHKAVSAFVPAPSEKSIMATNSGKSKSSNTALEEPKIAQSAPDTSSSYPIPENNWESNRFTFASLPQPTIELEEEAAARDGITVASQSSPRRRSYTKVEDGVTVKGEIIVAEAWKRHTKVYGGGVCLACLESEQRMRA